MLKALLNGKLGRPDGDDDDAQRSAWESLTGREDPLTAAVFERFAYLHPEDAWALLRGACANTRAHVLPEQAPSGAPELLFWPKLRPGEASGDAKHVEPDVIVVWGDVLLIIEAKHHSAQWAGQWVQQLRAVQGDPQFANKQTIFIALGGADATAFTAIVEEVTRALDQRVSFVLIQWTDLREAAEVVQRRTARSGAAIFDDMIAAIEAWGYRRRLGFDTLRSAAKDLYVRTTPADLARWRVR